jgi:transcriptional regulator with XRE-family HTH domain
LAKTFGKLLEKLRREQGLSVYALAQRTGLSDQAIHDLEQSDRTPSLETARRLAAALGVSLDWIANQLPPVTLPQPEVRRPRGRPKKHAAQRLPEAAGPTPGGQPRTFDGTPLAQEGQKRKSRGRRAGSIDE